MFEKLLHGVHPRVGDLCSVETGQHVCSRVCGECSVDERVELIAMRDTVGVGTESRIGGERRLTEHIGAEPPPLALILESQIDNLSVAGGVRSIRRDGGVSRTSAR